ncbi:guanine nucleotide-binding protein subunit beta [Prunus avium]|uniref:Guanine nucleotide-binding protein subunit beta n=1 Tax=Prunus avium TaxID=42229 RepID=A0A6P5TR74_PRUAV|nr:guanine nucleotide-binding protein subunit beta [Prunus avium]
MSVAELKERHVAASETVNSLRERLKQKRASLLDTDVAGYAKSQGKTPLTFGPTDLVCCRTLQGHTGKVRYLHIHIRNTYTSYAFCACVVCCKNELLLNALSYGLMELLGIGSLKCAIQNKMLIFLDFEYVNFVLVGFDKFGACRLFFEREIMPNKMSTKALDALFSKLRIKLMIPTLKLLENRFGTGSDDGTCRLFDIRTGHQLQVYHQQHGDNDYPPVKTIAFSISGRLLFAGYTNGDCYVWDTLLAKVVLNLGSLQNSHEAQISCLGLSADGSALCTGSWDTNLKIWAFGGHRKII